MTTDIPNGDTTALQTAIGDIAKSIYGDGLSRPVRELGEVLGDAIAIVGSPVRLAKVHALRFVERSMAKVPADRLIPPAPPLAKSVLDNVRYHDSGSEIFELFSNLLATGMDSASVSKAHPAFVHLISQLSPDEAQILYRLRKHTILREHIYRRTDLKPADEHKLSIVTKPTLRRIGESPRAELEESEQFTYVSEENELTKDDPSDALNFPDYTGIYLEHLRELALIGEKHDIEGGGKFELPGVPTIQKQIYHSYFGLSRFGQLFVDACVPKDPSPEWGW